jgi:superfamily II DNA/RNA helicase
MSFSHLGLSDKVLSAVAAAGYTTPTPIQDQAIPHVLARRDVLGIAQTGTGKTAAFVLPMLTMLEQGRARARMPRTLILEPTRELAAQVQESFIKYGSQHKLNVALLIGGVSFDDQDTKLTRGVDVLIATPGRLLDHHERGRLLMTGVELLVIDEADRMLDMGFIPDIERICKLVPFTRQTLFFTATMPPEIRRITEQFLHNPVRVEVARPATTVTTITQQLVKTGREPHEKRETLRRLIRSAQDLKNAIIFCNRSCTARCCGTGSPRSRCTATWTSRPAWQRSTSSAAARSPCWSHPTSPRAASTFRRSAMCSTSMSRTTPTTTCTASAAPAAPGAAAPRSASWRRPTRKPWPRSNP